MGGVVFCLSCDYRGPKEDFSIDVPEESDVVYLGKHIIVKFLRKSESGKTNVYQVLNEAGTKLGLIKWHGPWRQYCHVIPSTIFEDSFNIEEDYLIFAASCHRDVATCCDDLTKKHKAKLKQ
jgi:hypothetical protein